MRTLRARGLQDPFLCLEKLEEDSPEHFVPGTFLLDGSANRRWLDRSPKTDSTVVRLHFQPIKNCSNRHFFDVNRSPDSGEPTLKFQLRLADVFII